MEDRRGSPLDIALDAEADLATALHRTQAQKKVVGMRVLFTRRSLALSCTRAEPEVLAICQRRKKSV